MGTIACLSFLGLGLRGDFGISATMLARSGTSHTVRVYRTPRSHLCYIHNILSSFHRTHPEI